MARRRKISLNGLFLDYAPSGMETYTRHLVSALAKADPENEYRLSVRRSWPDHSLGRNVTPFRPLWPFSRSGSARGLVERADKFLWEQLGWPLSGRHFDLAHSLYFAAPLLHDAPLIVTVHDCIPLRPEYRHSRIAGLYAAAMAHTTKRADAIITVSYHARDEIASALGVPEERIHVTYEAPSPLLQTITEQLVLDAVRNRYRLPDAYFLCFSGERRKNITTLMQAWQSSKHGCAKLIVIGYPHPDDSLYPDLKALARSLDIEDSVRFVDHIAPEDLASVYSGAIALCFPSRYEGFGLPPLEAMACSIPVLAARASSIPEVVGDGAHLIDPDDVEGWVCAMERLMSDSTWRDELIERGRMRVEDFSWLKTAQETLAVYDWVLSQR